MTDEQTGDEPKDANESQPIESTPVPPVENTAREGNDVAQLLGSGAPMVKVKVQAGCFGLQTGDVTTLVQTEEVRLNLDNGNLQLLDGNDNDR